MDEKHLEYPPGKNVIQCNFKFNYFLNLYTVGFFFYRNRYQILSNEKVTFVYISILINVRNDIMTELCLYMSWS